MSRTSRFAVAAPALAALALAAACNRNPDAADASDAQRSTSTAQSTTSTQVLPAGASTSAQTNPTGATTTADNSAQQTATPPTGAYPGATSGAPPPPGYYPGATSGGPAPQTGGYQPPGPPPPGQYVSAPTAPAASPYAAAPAAPVAPAQRVRVRQARADAEELAAPLDPQVGAAMARPGLWRNTQTYSNGNTATTRTCESGRPEPIRMQYRCPQQRFHRTTTGGFAFSATCYPGNDIRAQIDLRAEGDFRTYYSGEMRLHARGPNGEITQSMHNESVYIGPCTGRERTGGGGMSGSVNAQSNASGSR